LNNQSWVESDAESYDKFNAFGYESDGNNDLLCRLIEDREVHERNIKT
jgi:hypothetical protein